VGVTSSALKTVCTRFEQQEPQATGRRLQAKGYRNLLVSTRRGGSKTRFGGVRYPTFDVLRLGRKRLKAGDFNRLYCV